MHSIPNPTTITTVVKRVRRRHAKSTAGCQTCKARKIKCDETKLQCENCVRFGLPCDFLPLPERKEWVSKSAAAAPRPEARRGRGRPRADWSRWVTDCRDQAPSVVDGRRVRPQRTEIVNSPSSSLSSSSSSSPELSVDDLELLHHYTTVTSMTVGDARLWRDEAPRLGREHPCIFHAMLSLAGYHLARLHPEGTTRYLHVAEHHYEAAARDATRMLPRLDKSNCQALYIVTVLICFTAFARGPSEGDLLLVAWKGCVPWISLLRGVRLVLETIGSSVVLSGILAPTSQHLSGQGPCDCRVEDASCLTSLGDGRQCSVYGRNWRTSLEGVRDLVKMSPDSAIVKMYDKEIGSLIGCFETTFRTDVVPAKCRHGQVSVIMAWVYTLDARFLEKLAQGDGIALKLLGHFAILVETLETYWFIEGWGAHILRQVREALGDEDVFSSVVSYSLLVRN